MLVSSESKVCFRLGLYYSGRESEVELLDPLFGTTKLDTLAMKLCIDNFKQRKSSRLIGIFIVEEEHESPHPSEGEP